MRQKLIFLFSFILLILATVAVPSVHAEANLPVHLDLKQKLTPETVKNGNYNKVAVQGNTLYFPDKQATKVAAVQAEDAAIKWEFSTGEQSEFRDIIAANGLIIFSTGSNIYALKDNGHEAVVQWTANTGGHSFVTDGTTLYFYKGASVAAVDLATGTEKWSYPLPQREKVHSTIAVGGGKVFFVTDNQIDMYRKMYALDSATAEPLWTTTTVDYYSRKPVYKDGKIYLNFYKEMVAYDAKTGNVLWKFEIAPNFTFEVNSDTIFARTLDGNLSAYDKETKALRWKTNFSDRLDGARWDTDSNGPLLVSQQYVLLENNGKIKWFDVKNGALVRELGIGGIQLTPVTAADNLLVAIDAANNLYLYTPAADTVKPDLALDTLTKRFSPYEGRQYGTLSFYLSEDAYVKAYVKSETGKVVRIMDFGLLRQGWNEKNWDGKTNSGEAASYGNYTFVFHVVDLAGNEVWLEDPNKKMKVADIFGTTVAQASVKKGPGNGYEEMAVIPAGTKVTIVDETTEWYQVNFYQDDREYLGYVLKSAVATRSNPNPTPPNQGTSVVYTVQAGDTLWKIAQKYGTTVQAIVEANKLDPTKYLYVGQKLTIPVQQPAPQPPTVTYVVQSGDTLWKIAQKYGTTVQAIVEANKLDPAKYLYVGQKLTIPVQQPAPQPRTVTHVVQSGDTLWKIAQKYGTTIQVIVEANKLDPAKYLYVGQTLMIPSK